MGLRKFNCYRRVKRAYTRHSKFKKKSFVKVVPPNKIVKFDFGELKKDFKYRVDLLVKEQIQVRNNALESARTVTNRKLSDEIGAENYHFKIRVYPHHILRENKMLVGAGADRMQTGMQHSFGRPIGTAAQLKKNQVVFSCYVDEKHIEAAKQAMHASFSRLPGKYTVEVGNKKIK